MDVVEALGAIDVRVGTIVGAEPFPEARKPSYRLLVDFGPEIGTRSSSAQITVRYLCGELIGKRVLGVVNLPSKRIAGFVSEALLLGVNDDADAVVLIRPDFADVPNGSRLY